MIYLTLEDFYAVIQAEELVDVVGPVDDPTDEGTITLEQLELYALGEMEGYLDVRYDAAKILDPAEPRPATVVMHLVDMVLHSAYSKVHPNNIPELREKRYSNAINYLEKLASGFINPSLPIKPDQPTTPLRYGSSVPKTDQYF